VFPDILKNVGKQTVDGPHWLPYFCPKTSKVSGVHQLFSYWHSSKYLLHRRKKFIQVWNNLSIS